MLMGVVAFATTYTTTSDGSYAAAANWVSNNKPGNFWGAGDSVIVNHAMNLNNNIGFAGVLIVSTSGSITGTSRNIQLNNGAEAYFNGPIDIQDLSLNSTSFVDATASIDARDLSIQNNSTFNTTAPIDLSDDFTNSGGAFTSTSTMDVDDDFQLNNSGSFSITGALTVGDDMELNNGTNATFGSTVNVTDKITLNGGTGTFNGAVNAGGDVTFNSNSTAIIKSTFESGDDITLNGGAVNVASTGTLEADNDITVNGSSTLDNHGTVDAGDDFILNGGSVNTTGTISATDDITQNGGSTLTNNAPGRIEAGDDYTHNGGTLTNNHHMVVGDRLTVNGGATHNGNGLLQVERIRNNGNIGGTLDICSVDGNNPTFSGSGSYSGSVTFCENAAAFPLPVELISFTAKPEVNQNVLLLWQTASELNNDYFILNKSIDGGENFEEIAKVYGAGTTNEKQEYQFLDESFNSGVIYYQLIQVDFDGAITSLDIIGHESQISEINEPVSSIYPNPFFDKFIVSNVQKNSEVSMISINGSEVLIELNQTEDNSLEVSLPSGLPSGIYFLILSSKGNRKVHKVYKR